jgi:hypothetical protein
MQRKQENGSAPFLNSDNQRENKLCFRFYADFDKVQSHHDTTLLYILTPSQCAQESLGTEIFNVTTKRFPSKAPPPLPSSVNICVNTNVPLSIILKFDTAPCHFLSSGNTGNSVEYPVSKHCTPTSVLRNKTYSGKQPPAASRTTWWDSAVYMATFHIKAVAVN